MFLALTTYGLEPVKQAQDEDEADDEEEVFVPRRRDGRWGPTDPYWQDIYTTLFTNRERSTHALVEALQSDSTETVTLLLDLGAQPNFYRKNRAPCLYLQLTDKWRYAVEVDHPPPSTAM
ncbi:hypothetical protein N7499_004433 [Penicillium canescens]|uniref:uncharacterized protein n=1 Tax=Penicillium canescens TaxID=5083 RepID=UPI0026DEE366|nr:uncharacterized protein N7446_005274 [Penicillium canescens]KAJ6068237.1 hypothetical protein N7446_005274 [Penicillium canescens]KAJ6084804.1 hypothetical protein N7499_004433 [Penicillium canescens]KAJ6161590.1 hypothetical protein N7485_009820 [Penicillium canescens]